MSNGKQAKVIEQIESIAIGRIEPRGSMVLVEIVTVEKVGGMIMPQQAQEGSKTVVVAVGPHVHSLKPGDEVAWNGYGTDYPNQVAAFLVNNGPKNAMLMHERQITAIIHPAGVDWVKACEEKKREEWSEFGDARMSAGLADPTNPTEPGPSEGSDNTDYSSAAAG